jgi:hypothetical protein
VSSRLVSEQVELAIRQEESEQGSEQYVSELGAGKQEVYAGERRAGGISNPAIGK